jgi:hypothetical protein
VNERSEIQVGARIWTIAAIRSSRPGITTFVPAITEASEVMRVSAKAARYLAASLLSLMVRSGSTCGTDISAIHYRPEAEPNRPTSIQLF